MPTPAVDELAFSLPSLTTTGKLTFPTDGPIALVVFWATWHEPSKKMFPELEKLQRAYGPRGFTVLAISVDQESSDDEVGAAARAWGASFPVGVDRGFAVTKAWNASHMPTVFVVDRRGVVRHRHAGYHGEEDAATFAKEVEALL